jgi:hypothetical protein
MKTNLFAKASVLAIAGLCSATILTPSAFAGTQTTTRTGPNGNVQTTNRTRGGGSQTTTRSGPNGNVQTTNRTVSPGSQTTTRTGPNGNEQTTNRTWGGGSQTTTRTGPKKPSVKKL